MCLCGLTFPQGRLHWEKKTKRKKENVLNENSLGSASRRVSTERRKTKKTSFCFYATDLSPRVDYIERRKITKNFFCVSCTKKVFLSLSSLRRSSPWGRWLLINNIFLFSLSLSSLCVFYPRGRSDCIKSQYKVFVSLSSLCVSSPWGRSYRIFIWDILCFVLLVFFLSV